MDSRDVIGQTEWIGCGVKKSRLRGVSDLQEDEWVGDRRTDGWMDRLFTQMGNPGREPYLKGSSQVGG